MGIGEEGPLSSHLRDSKESHELDDGVECIAEFPVVNEFARVRVRKLRSRGGERLEITSMDLGYSIRLDALALEALSWQSPVTISKFLEFPFGPEGDDAAEAGRIGQR